MVRNNIYPRKNWSSLIMFNCGHELNQKLTPQDVNTKSGRWLHTFQWLPDKEADIGTIPEEWNWLDNHSSTDIDAKNVHFTTGGPWFKDWGSKRDVDNKYAIEWSNDAQWLQMQGILDTNKDYDMKINFVTCFNEDLYNRFGSLFLNLFMKIGNLL